MISEQYKNLLVGKIGSTTELEKILSRQKKDIIDEKNLDLIRVEECGEGLVPVVEYVPNVIIGMTPQRKRFPEETLYLRKSIAQSLVQVAEEIFPNRLKVFDAFRPIELQQQWFEQVYQKVQQKNPTWSAEQLRAETFLYVFPPSWNLQTPPPHSTGAAVDLTITDSGGVDLDMGTKYAEFDNPLMYTNATGLSSAQRENRIMLVSSMTKAGLVNYPGEWWHFSFGDREWIAYLDLQLPAIFGRAKDPYKRR